MKFKGYWEPEVGRSSEEPKKKDAATEKQPAERKFQLEMDFGELHTGKMVHKQMLYDWQT